MIITLTGGPAVGKSTIAGKLIETLGGIKRVPSLTTRPRRGDEPLDEYLFLAEKDFAHLDSCGQFAWTATVRGYMYGTRYDDVKIALAGGAWVMVLVPDALAKLRVIAARLAQSKSVRSFHIWTDKQTIRRRLREQRHLSDRSIREELARFDEVERICSDLQIPVSIRNNDGELKDAVARIRRNLPK